MTDEKVDAVARAASIARQLGMRGPRTVASGRYLLGPTETEYIDIVVFSRDGLDCVGLEGRKNKRDWVIAHDDRWRKEGFLPHQESPSSHKSVSTYIQEYPPNPNGDIDLGLRKAYTKLKKIFSHR